MSRELIISVELLNIWHLNLNSLTLLALNKFIESTTAFTCNLSPTYHAVDYVELNPGFTIPQDYTLCVDMIDQCVLYQD